MRQSDALRALREAANAAEHASIRDGASGCAAPGVPPFVILRGDGRPTYNWASVVDDLDFGITHVIRGNDHLRQHAAARGRRPGARRRAAAVHPPRGRARRATASSRSARAPPRSPTCARPATRRRRSSTSSGWSRAPAPARCSTWTSWSARFDPDRIARGDVRLDPARLRSLSALHLARAAGTPSSSRACSPFCPPGHAARGRRGDGAGAARRPHPGRGGRARRVRARRARRALAAARAGRAPRGLPGAARRGAGARRSSTSCAGAGAAASRRGSR